MGARSLFWHSTIRLLKMVSVQIAVGIDFLKGVLLINDSCGHGDDSTVAGELLQVLLTWSIAHRPNTRKVRSRCNVCTLTSSGWY